MAGKKVKVTLLVNTVGAKAFDTIEVDAEVVADLVANRQAFVAPSKSESD